MNCILLGKNICVTEGASEQSAEERGNYRKLEKIT
jgi:hypothetical protein